MNLWSSGGSNQAEEASTTDDLGGPQREREKEVKNGDDSNARIQAARDRFLARKGNK